MRYKIVILKILIKYQNIFLYKNNYIIIKNTLIIAFITYIYNYKKVC